MVGVLDVLEVELPVVRQRLGKPTCDDHGLVQHALDARSDLLAQIFLDRRDVVGQAAEHQAGKGRDAQLARPVLGAAEGLAHAALAVDAVLEGDRLQVAFQVVVPGVVDAGEVARLAAAVERDQRAAMRAAVLEGVDFVVEVARHDHRHGADEGGAIVAGLSHFGLEAKVVPDRTFEDAALLARVDFRRLVDPERHAGQRALRPLHRMLAVCEGAVAGPDVDVHGSVSEFPLRSPRSGYGIPRLRTCHAPRPVMGQPDASRSCAPARWRPTTGRRRGRPCSCLPSR